jgi:hypothetical protein
MSDAKNEFIRLAYIALGKDLKRWFYPPSIVFVKSALKLNLAFIDGVFGVKRSLAQLVLVRLYMLLKHFIMCMIRIGI